MKTINKKQCSGCTACYSICPQKCIEMKEDKEGFRYPVFDKSKCIDCGMCVKVCPWKRKKNIIDDVHEIHICVNNDKDEVYRSSSGGLFVLFAKYILKEGGVVYGAGFDRVYKLTHKRVDSEAALDEILKSKYIQSDLRDIFSYVKKDLEEGKKVLFCGTPCQCSGLKNLLKENKEKLFTIDFVCHGVPSQKVFDKYLDSVLLGEEKKNLNISFRDKSNGWEKPTMKIEKKGNTLVERSGYDDPYLSVFLSDIALRLSCYNCIYKSSHRESDISLSDAWCIEDYDSSLYNEQGTSCVIIHSKKGNDFFNSIKNSISDAIIEEDYLKKYSFGTFGYPVLDRRRRLFFKKIDKVSFYELSRKYSEIDLVSRIQRKMKRLKSKIIIWKKH